MGVYIKGMEMPKGCAFCKIKRRNGKKMACPFGGEFDIHDPMSADHRLDGCPLGNVSAHGKLIDASKIKFYYDGLVYIPYNDYVGIAQYFANQIDTLPTVIPAEEGET